MAPRVRSNQPHDPFFGAPGRALQLMEKSSPDGQRIPWVGDPLEHRHAPDCAHLHGIAIAGRRASAVCDETG